MGPKVATVWFSADNKLAFAHAQLSFFKAAEPQPVRNARGTIFAVCNGEIYNHRILAERLRQSGIETELKSDVEIIPYIYELNGVSSFAQLRGEFAIALYDAKKQKLFLVRDRFGIKPLYYHATACSGAFASEIKALFANPRITPTLDLASVATKLFGITLRGNTAFSTIKEITPGSYLELSAAGLSERSYWSLKLGGFGGSLDAAERACTFKDLLDEAVRIRLQGDYPIGAYLSGGIDSSAVLASMVHSGAQRLKAFTIAFEDQRLDESAIAVQTAARLGVEHHIVKVGDKDIAENFLDSIWHSEIPVINCHGTAKFILSRAASAHVKAIMTGEGADELFAGYAYFGNDRFDKQVSFREKFSSWTSLLGSRWLTSGFLTVPREKDLKRLRALFAWTPHLGLRALYYGRLIRPFLHRDFKRYYSPLSTLKLVREEFRSANLEPLTKTNVDRFFALKYDLPAYLLNFLADRLEMAHSIEGRLPFLDDDVVAFAAQLSDEALIGEAAGKKLIRTAFTQRLPQEAIASGKQIFLAPPTAVNQSSNRIGRITYCQSRLQTRSAFSTGTNSNSSVLA